MKRALRRVGFGTVLLSVGIGCSHKDEKSESAPIAATLATRVAPRSPATLDPEAIEKLARDPSETSEEALLRVLLSEGSHRSWAALGLAPSCRKKSASVEKELTLALAFSSARNRPKEELTALSWALSNCGSESSGASLESLLVTPNPPSKDLLSSAAIALGHHADLFGSLSERATTKLLDLAEQENDATFLYPLTRVPKLGKALAARTLEVAVPLLTKEKPGRRHALLALGSAGELARAPLGEILRNPKYGGVERASAAQALARLEDQGQSELLESLSKLELPATHEDDAWLPLRATLRALSPPKRAEVSLVSLAKAEFPKNATRPLRRRFVAVRCRAAELIAKNPTADKLLLECDPDTATGSIEGALALVRALGRTRLEGARRKVFLPLLDHADPRVHSEALRLAFEHRELHEKLAELDARLVGKSDGARIAILRGLATHPEVGLETAKEDILRPTLLDALAKILKAPVEEFGLEAKAAAIDATGALRALSLKPAIEALCSGTESSLFPPSEHALSLLGDPERRCRGKSETEVKIPLGAAPVSKPAPVRVEVTSDVGNLAIVFDEPGTETTRALLVAAIEKGFFDGIVVSAISEGYGVQFGDRDGDGMVGGALVLPDERTPSLFEGGRIGLSGFLRGSALPHFFVALTDAFPLTFERVIVGRIEGPFSLLVPGDELTTFRVTAK